MLLILGSGSILHLLYGEYMSIMLGVFALFGIAKTRPKINTDLFYSWFSLQLAAFLVLLYNYVTVPFENNGYVYSSLYFRISIFNIVLFYFYANHIDVLQTLTNALKLIAWIAVINIIFSPIMIEFSSYSTYPVNRYSIFGIFNWFSTFDVFGIKIWRNQSIFWEPGILQIFMNMLLMLALRNKVGKRYILISIFLILSTFSTTGYFIMALLLMRYMVDLANSRRVSVAVILIGSLGVIISSYALYYNASLKFSGIHVSSFDLRMYDMRNALNILREYYLTGIGINPAIYLQLTSLYAPIGNSYYTYSVSIFDGIRGNTNSIVMVLINYGIFVGMFYYTLLYRQDIYREDRLLFFIIIVIANASVPLIFTHFFIFIALSSIYHNNSKPIKEVDPKNWTVA